MTDAAIQRLQNLPDFHVQTINPSDGAVVDWFPVKPGDYAPTVILNPQNLHTEVTQIPVQILEWARIAARAQRVWEARERAFRVWKATQVDEARKAVEADPKTKRTQAQVEAEYRLKPAYQDHCQQVEAAAEAFNCAQAMVDAFRAKRDMVKAFAIRTKAGMDLSTD